MNTSLTGIDISPVQMENRKELGIKAGDTVKVHQKIQDKGKTRIQVFEGIVLARKHGSEPGATFTVRKVASGVGVEKIYPLYSPTIDKIEIVKRSKVRRSKLYFIREKVARQIKRQMRRMSLTSMTTLSEAEEAARIQAEAKAIEEAEQKALEEASLKAKEAEEAKLVEVESQVAVEPDPAEAPKAESETEEAKETVDTEAEKKA
jgi:large subunit ribosomal protein L19